MANILLGLWFLVYGLDGFGVNIPQAKLVLAILALIIAIVLLVPAIRR